MSNIIPRPLLDVLTTYVAHNKDNALHIIEAALASLVSSHERMMARGVVDVANKGVNPHAFYAMCDAIIIMSNKMKGAPTNTGNTTITPPSQHQGSNGVLTVNSPSTSPHSPVRKGKRHGWFKTVSSVDYKSINGYGVKGKLLTLEDIDKLPDNTIFVWCAEDKSTAIMRRGPFKTPIEVQDPDTGNPVDLHGVDIVKAYTKTEWHDLFDDLTHKYNVTAT